MTALTFDVSNDTLFGVACLVIILIGLLWIIGRRPWR